MIKLSKMSDHALVLSAQLAAAPGVERAAADWARMAGIPEATATKLLKKMCAAGICESKRGKGGGYRLARQASEVSFLAVVEAVDGPLAFSDCGVGARGCRHELRCAAKSHVVKIGAAIRASLGAMAIAEIAAKGGRHVQ